MGKVKNFFENAAIMTGALVMAVGEMAEENSKDPNFLRERVRDLKAANKTLETEMNTLRDKLNSVEWELNNLKFRKDSIERAERSMRNDNKVIYELLVTHKAELCKSIKSFDVDRMIRLARYNS